MKNNYIVNGKNVIDIIFDLPKKGKSKIRYFLLEDNTKIKANGTMMKIRCSICNTWHEYRFASRYENKVYVCGSCRVKGELNPFFGKKHSQEFKDRLSVERKGTWCVGENNVMFGKSIFDFMTVEEIDQWRKNLSIASSGENNGMFGETLSSHMSIKDYTLMKQRLAEHTYKSFSKEKQKEISNKLSTAQKKLQEANPIAYSKMKAKGGFATKSKACNYTMSIPEKLLEEYLIANNVKYDYSCIMGFKEKCYQYDFIIHDKRILIEVQGNYWHGDPELYNEDGSNGKRKLNTIQKSKIECDKLKKEFAKEKNFTLICIWESEIKNNDFSKLKEIL